MTLALILGGRIQCLAAYVTGNLWACIYMRACHFTCCQQSSAATGCMTGENACFSVATISPSFNAKLRSGVRIAAEPGDCTEKRREAARWRDARADASKSSSAALLAALGVSAASAAAIAAGGGVAGARRNGGRLLPVGVALARRKEASAVAEASSTAAPPAAALLTSSRDASSLLLARLAVASHEEAGPPTLPPLASSPLSGSSAFLHRRCTALRGRGR